jgi:hypothetical protein
MTEDRRYEEGVRPTSDDSAVIGDDGAPTPHLSGGKTKPSYVGAPAIFALSTACQDLERAFGGYGVYLVGSALQRPDWRDVDVRLIMRDADFAILFPGTMQHGGSWECNPRWLWMTVSISERLSKLTGLPIDFQFQPQTHANKHHKGRRDCLSMYINEAPDE